MKKKSIKMIIALLVLAALIGAYFLVCGFAKKKEAEKAATENAAGQSSVGQNVGENGEIVVIDDSVDGIVTIAYTTDLGDINFSRMTGSWEYPSDRSMPVNQSFVQGLADAFTKITAKREITGQGDESAYGFDEPTLQATVCTSTGHTRVYTVGNKNEMSDGYYLKHNDRIYIIDTTLVDATYHSLFEAIEAGSLEAIAADSITSLTVNGEEVPNKAGYANIGIIGIENYKNKEGYGFDGTENKVVVTYVVESPLYDEAGNLTTTVAAESSYSFSYVESDGLVYIMLPDDVCIYSATGTEALFNEITE